MVEPLAWGTSQGQAATFTFQAKCSATGTYSYSFNNSSSSYSYVGTYSISTAGAWTPISATIPAPPSGSPWATFNANQFSLQIRFDLGSGSTYATSTTEAWQSGHYETVTGAIELIAQTNGYCEFAAVHLQPGSIGGGYFASGLWRGVRARPALLFQDISGRHGAGAERGRCGRPVRAHPVASAYVSVYFSLPTGLYTGSGSSLISYDFQSLEHEREFPRRHGLGRCDRDRPIRPRPRSARVSRSRPRRRSRRRDMRSASMRYSIWGSIDARADHRARAGSRRSLPRSPPALSAPISGAARSARIPASRVSTTASAMRSRKASRRSDSKSGRTRRAITTFRPIPCASTQSLSCYASLMFASSVWDNPNLTRMMFTAHDFAAYVGGGNSATTAISSPRH